MRRDVIYLDLALEAAGRGLVESGMSALKSAVAAAATTNGTPEELQRLLAVLALCCENAALSTGSNQELVLCLKDIQVR